MSAAFAELAEKSHCVGSGPNIPSGGLVYAMRNQRACLYKPGFGECPAVMKDCSSAACLLAQARRFPELQCCRFSQ